MVYILTLMRLTQYNFSLLNSFFGAVIIYLAVGTAYQYFVNGERGVRVIPNFDFWKAFVIYVLVNIIYLCFTSFAYIYNVQCV